MKKYAIRTFGCQMNHADSARVAQMCESAGFLPASESEADFLVVNTCSIRQKAEDKAFGFIRNFKRRHPKSKIGVTGCMVRQTGDRTLSRDHLLRHRIIDLVFRIEDTARVPKILERHFPSHDFSGFASDFGSGSIENYFKIVPKVENRHQVLVPIMQGCDKFCTFCIVPYSRGRELSRPMAEIFDECAAHVRNGAKEITLLGQNVNSYTDGGDSGGKHIFYQLLEKIDSLHSLGLSRVRWTSPHPQDFCDDLIATLPRLKTFCNYVHLPAQHGSNRILKSMNRNYSVEKYEEIVRKLRQNIPDLTIATDIIVGFPGETESDFERLCELARRVKFDFSYTAIFSPRQNTPAAKMKSAFIPEKIKKDRFARFDSIIKETAFANRARYVGKNLEILVEKSQKLPNGNFANSGRSREFFEVWFESGRPFAGREVHVQITDQKNYVLHGLQPEWKNELKLVAGF